MKWFLFMFIVGLLLLCTPSNVQAQGPGLYELELQSDDNGIVGTVSIWNSPQVLHVKVIPADGWKVTDTQVYVGAEPVPIKKGKPELREFPFKAEYDPSHQMYDLVLMLKDDLEAAAPAKLSDAATNRRNCRRLAPLRSSLSRGPSASVGNS